MERLTGGFINEVWRTNGHVTKSYKPHEHISTPADVRFNREFTALTTLGGSIAPNLVGVDHENKTLDCEFVGGENMRLALPGMDNDAKSVLFKDMGTKLKSLHDMYGEPIGDYRYQLRRKAIEQYQKFSSGGVPEALGINSDVILHRLIRQILPEISRAMNNQDKLTYIHGDYWSNNILGDAETGTISRVIDWEYFTVGMPQEDIAYTYLWDLMKHPQHTGDFFKGYGKIDAVPHFAYLKVLDLVGNSTVEQVKNENGSGFVTDHSKLL